MNYVQLHLGDWIAGTLDLTPTERGVYMDLLVRYYKEERPLTQDECKRIARAYAPDEQEAMHYVLQRFFTLENGEYRQSRCDEEIEKAQAVSTKRKRAAASRWAKKTEIDASEYPNAEQTHSKCNANGMLTINHKPITNNQIEKSATHSTRKRVERPADVDPQVWEDWQTARKSQKAPITQTVIDGFRKEAKEARISLEEAVRISIERGWRGFKAEWLQDKGKSSKPTEDEIMDRYRISRQHRPADLPEEDLLKGWC